MRAKGLEDLVEYDTRSRIPAAHSALSGNTKKMDLTRITSAQGRGGAQEYVARVVPDFEKRAGEGYELRPGDSFRGRGREQQQRFQFQ